jgi:hypothetical protein
MMQTPPGNIPHPLVQAFNNIMPPPPPVQPPTPPVQQPPSAPVEVKKHEKGGLEISLVADIQKSYLIQHAATAPQPQNSQGVNGAIGAMAPQPGWGGKGR